MALKLLTAVKDIIGNKLELEKVSDIMTATVDFFGGHIYDNCWGIGFIN